MKKTIIAYIPVLHDGYFQFLEKHKDAEKVFVFGEDLIKETDYLHKEVRALDPKKMKHAVESLGVISEVHILVPSDIESTYAEEICMPDEDVCRDLAEKYLKDKNVIFDPVFLRWDRSKGFYDKKIGPEKVITEDEFMNTAFVESEKSSDWWRQVGGVIVRDGEIMLKRYNKHLPSNHQPYVDGDPRARAHKGEALDLYTSQHAEAGLIAEAARKGIALGGADMYVTDFPCPVCAKQIAEAGIKKLYYTRGYGVLDGERVLKNAGVELIQIKRADE